jgi:capsid protein
MGKSVTILGSDGRPVRTARQRTQSADGRHEIVMDGIGGAYAATGYHSRSIAVSEGQSYSQGSGEQHQRFDRHILVDESRGLDRDNPLYASIIDTAITYILGSGFSLQSEPKIEQLWNDWWRSPEITNRLSGGEVEQMVLREIILCGDHLIVKTKKGLIDLIESERLAQGNRTSTGIATDSLGRPTRFSVCAYGKNGMLNYSKETPYKADQVIFLACPRRPSELRGMPILQSTFAMLHRINDTCDAEAIAMQLQARLAIAIKKTQAAQMGYLESKDDAGQSTTEDTGAFTTRITELKYAIIAHLEPDEDVTTIERNIPGKDFPQSLRMFLRLMGLPLGMPLELVLLDWTQSNYSQSRAVIQQAYERFVKWQTKLIAFFYDPLLRWKLAQWEEQKLLGNKAAKNVKWEWITPTSPWIDPQKEMEAVGLKLDRGLTTHGRECKALGIDRNDVNDAREAEIRDAIKRVQKIKEDTQVAVPWQVFAGAVTAPAAKKPEPAPAAENDKNQPGVDENA